MTSSEEQPEGASQGERRARRRLKRHRAPIQVEFESETVEGEGLLKGVRIASLFVEVDGKELPEKGEAIRLLFRDPDGRELELFGSVGPQGRGGWPGFCVQLMEVTDEYRAFYEGLLTG